MPLLNGPLHPWGQILSWLWAHGEYSIPVVMMVAAALTWGDSRDRIKAIVRELLAWTVVIVAVLTVIGVIGWVLVKMYPML